MEEKDSLPRICDWLAGKDIFITGATGFLGKVLLEKIIRCTPNVRNIYILIRNKRGKSVEERLKDLTKFEIFDLINVNNPNWLDKLIPLNGDCSEPRLGLSKINWDLIKDNVSVIFHTAASIRFDDPLTRAIHLNVYGTKQVCQLALESKKLEVLVHVSTTYCNNHIKVIDERLYPPLGDWKKDLEIMDGIDEQLLNIVTQKYTHFQPNTYTYTKGIAEQVINDMCNGKVPTVILRPSIVVSSFEDPFPGWLDNFAGIASFFLVTAKGINRTSLTDSTIVSDFIPVDVVIKFMLIAACWKATLKTKNLEVLNASSRELSSYTSGSIVAKSKEMAKTMKTTNQLWYPTVLLTKSTFVYTVAFYVLQLIPSIILDAIARLFRKKPMLLYIQRKIFCSTINLCYFQMNQWTFNNDKMMKLTSKINPLDVKCFLFAVKHYELETFLKNTFNGGQKYLLKEPVSDEKYINKMYYVHKAVSYAFYAFLSWHISKILFDVTSSFISDILNQ